MQLNTVEWITASHMIYAEEKHCGHATSVLSKAGLTIFEGQACSTRSTSRASRRSLVAEVAELEIVFSFLERRKTHCGVDSNHAQL
jgi:hypothetical protein